MYELDWITDSEGMPTFEVDCVLSVGGVKQDTICSVKRNLVRATISNDIPAGEQIRLDLLSMSNTEDLDTCYVVLVMNSTYTAGFAGEVCTSTLESEFVSNFIDIYEVESNGVLRSTGETKINFALYGDTDFALL